MKPMRPVSAGLAIVLIALGLTILLISLWGD
jgi:hypothetical protein